VSICGLNIVYCANRRSDDHLTRCLLLAAQVRTMHALDHKNILRFCAWCEQAYVALVAGGSSLESSFDRVLSLDLLTMLHLAALIVVAGSLEGRGWSQPWGMRDMGTQANSQSQ
jgi:hypothetical protein